MKTAAQFFYEQAGYSYNTLTETAEDGRQRCALALADAEELYLQAHRVAEVECHWQDDPDGADSAGNAEGPFKSACITINGETVASLSSIDQPDSDYRRVVRAELAMECAEQLSAVL